jgi:hypothetical protein
MIYDILPPILKTHEKIPDFSPFGLGGDLSTQPLGEILDHRCCLQTCNERIPCPKTLADTAAV